MNIEEVNPKEALQEISNGTILIDVREPYELEDEAYGVKYLHIPMGEIAERLSEVPKDQPVIVGCRSGKRSMNVCMYLAMNGYNNIRNLEGGIMGWVSNGCPTK